MKLFRAGVTSAYWRNERAHVAEDQELRKELAGIDRRERFLQEGRQMGRRNGLERDRHFRPEHVSCAPISPAACSCLPVWSWRGRASRAKHSPLSASPALVLNKQGKVLTANSLIHDIKAYVSWRAFDRISLKDKAADNLLRDAIAAIDVAGGSVRSFPVRDAGAEAMMVAHVIPIRLSARDIFVRCAAALVLTPVTLPQAPPVELVQSLFDLSPAEARVARDLAAGETVETIASARGVSQNTIRAQVRGVLEKTGCNCQTDVVSLLTAISPARLTHPA
jgi:DNA-binding CsgD family transcriptional regulator